MLTEHSNSMEAEAAVVGSILIDTDALPTVEGIVQPLHFHYPNLAEVYQALIDMRSANPGVHIDLLMLRDYLKAKGRLGPVGGVEYLVELVESTPTAQNAQYYAEIVYDMYLKRQLYAFGRAVMTAAAGPGKGIDLLLRAETDFASVVALGRARGATSTAELAEPALASFSDAPTFLRTGMSDLDRLIHGFERNEMIVVGARPGVGKSAIMLDLMAAQAKRGVPVACFSLEMDTNQLMQRLYANVGRVDCGNIRDRRLSAAEMADLAEARDLVKGWPIWFDDTTRLTPLQLKSRIRTLQRDHGVRVAFVDYLQLLEVPPGMRFNGRYAEVTYISREIKLIARELGIPIVVLAQLNRESVNQGRAIKRPRMSDLRDSGAIEQDADIIMLLHREDVELPPDQQTGNAELIVAKARSGRTGTVALTFLDRWVSFAERVIT